MYEIKHTHMTSPLQVHLMYYAYRTEHKTPCTWAYSWRTGPGASEMLCHDNTTTRSNSSLHVMSGRMFSVHS
jgi:hypothetical protein